MATFERRGHLQWRVRIRRTNYPDQTKTFDTKAEAEAWARKIENEMDEHHFVDRTESDKNTLGDVLTRYKEEVTSEKRGAGPEASRLSAMLIVPQMSSADRRLP